MRSPLLRRAWGALFASRRAPGRDDGAAGIGRWGLHERVEPHVRRLVAHQLGVAAGALGATVSLRQDLAADSLDLVELTLLLEREFDITMPDRIVENLQSYGDLVEATVDRVLAGARAARPNHEQPHVSVCLQGAQGVSDGTVERVGQLTPYAAQTISDEARDAGPGARLEIVVSRGASDAALASVRTRFEHLVSQGIFVSVRRYETVDGGARLAR
jgi:acyl carrier protein